MKTLNRLLLEEQSDLGLHCLPRTICPKTLDHYGMFLWRNKQNKHGYLSLYMLQICSSAVKQAHTIFIHLTKVFHYYASLNNLIDSDITVGKHTPCKLSFVYMSYVRYGVGAADLVLLPRFGLSILEKGK